MSIFLKFIFNTANQFTGLLFDAVAFSLVLIVGVQQSEDLQKALQGLGRDTANELENILISDKLSTFRTFFNQETKPYLTENFLQSSSFCKSGGRAFCQSFWFVGHLL